MTYRKATRIPCSAWPAKASAWMPDETFHLGDDGLDRLGAVQGCRQAADAPIDGRRLFIEVGGRTLPTANPPARNFG